MKGVSFRLYTEKGKPVGAISKDNTYKFWELTDDEAKATYVTGDDGTIHIEELPIGKYYFEETGSALSLTAKRYRLRSKKAVRKRLMFLPKSRMPRSLCPKQADQVL